MQSPDSLASVAAFHHLFGHPVLEHPQIPDNQRAQLRVSLLAEELEEFKQAIEENDLVAAADALCDIQYVLSGAVLEFGLGTCFKEMFDEVQRSNMSKACHSEDEAKQTVAYYKNERNTDCFYEKKDDLYLVYRMADRKTLKSIFYSPANLDSIVLKK
jgi:predicted HAD superfamily Cof-like phosphohydrolase